MSQVPVKWCCSADLQDKAEAIAVYGDEPVAVVPLEALRKVVEGLSDQFWSYEQRILCEDQRAGLTHDQRIGAAVAFDWVKQRLLASLGDSDETA